MSYTLSQYRVIDPFIERNWLSANRNYVTLFPRPDVRGEESVAEALAARPLLGAYYVGTDTTDAHPPLSLIYRDRLTNVESLIATRGTDSTSIDITSGRCCVGGIYAELPEDMNISTTIEDNYHDSSSYTATLGSPVTLVITYGPTNPETNDFVLSLFEYFNYETWYDDPQTTNFEKSAIIIGFARVGNGGVILFPEDVFRGPHGNIDRSGNTYIIPNLNPLDCGIVTEAAWVNSDESGWDGLGNS